MPMSEDKLKATAKSLMHEEPTYWGDFPEAFLMAWLDDRQPDHSVVCAYCDLPLMSANASSFRHGTVDHLLPKDRYHWLVEAQSNAVPCCFRCNRIKGRFDPNKDNPVYSQVDGNELTKEQRKELIARARKYVTEKLTEWHRGVWGPWDAACCELDSHNK